MRSDNPPGVLIGREHPTGQLRAEVARAAESHGGLVLVTGEAGIGKTTLVTSAADDARRDGALVLGGSCWDSDNAPGYWPWVQVVRGLRRGATEQEWADIQRATGDGLGILLGETTRTEQADAFQLYDAVTSALVTISQTRPVVVVLDDLHWADPASLKLLEFAAQHTWFERVLLVGTYRDVEVETADHALAPLILSLLGRATTLTLTGLEAAEVGALIARTVGDEPDADVVAEVHRRTGGNPFFVEQTARLWHGGGTVTAIAPGVRDAVRRRLSLLPEPVTQLLTSASVLGGEFHRQVLAATVSAPVAQVDRLLERATAARLVLARGAGSFAFAHDLLRETLYETLDEADLRGRHAAVVRALDRSPALAERVFPTDLARHAYLAGDEVERAHAVRLLLAAGRYASSRLASEEACGHYRRGLELAGDAEPGLWTVLAYELFQQLDHDGDVESARRLLDDAMSYVRAQDDPILLARVALSAYHSHHGSGRSQAAAFLFEAHHALFGDEQETERSSRQLAIELTIRLEREARHGGDDEALGFSLWTQHDTLWGIGTAKQRLALTDELVAIARRTGDTGTELFGTSLRWVALLELGDPGYLDQLEHFTALAARTGDKRMAVGSLVDQSLIAAFTGRFTEAEAYAEQATKGRDLDDEAHIYPMIHHMRWQLLYLKGEYEQLAELHRTLTPAQYSHAPWIAAVTALRAGDAGPALCVLDEGIGDVDESRSYTPLWLRIQAQTAVVTKDPELGERARAALTPFSGQYLVSMWGFDLSGPVDYWLAALDAAQQRWDEAIAGFGEAMRSAELMRARPWVLEAKQGLAEALLGRDAPGDADEAAAVRTELEREFAELGISRTRPESTVEEAPEAEFRFAGGVWSLGFEGHSVHLPDTKGLRDLHHLLSRPGTDVASVRLLSPDGGEEVVAAARLGGDDVLDDEAKARYRQRLAVLDERIDDAAARGDDAAAAEFDRERAALLTELRSAAGLGGRTRRLGDEAERARKAVTARIRDTLRKLDDRHPRLANHLRDTVSTGASCRYEPAGISWRL
ncbi:ATP-binding protein [Prauserella cavernicola]|uniref:AAA family ATPase n=1 Tax=Prauserella cavernicola TaxID=2800127 RepID=A0A934V782_9PSEU|nr:AAA family ATPase [Prauserella cavernicola]MBK1788307.1 AAA family ATPase [Prauserella cavernicola]